MSKLVQYDSSPQKIGGLNITESVQGMDKLVFNESYTVIGNELQASSIYASYDLTIIGDVEANEIEVGGLLNVTGNIKATKISCNKSIFCNGNIEAEVITGAEIVANNITCKKITSTANIVVRMTVDAKELIEAEKAVISGEGIVGDGAFSAQNAIAIDFFEFDGEVKGKVMEMATDEVFGEPRTDSTISTEGATFDEAFDIMVKKISDGLKEAGNIDEDELLAFIKKVSDGDSVRYHDWETIMNRLVELSYADSITNLADYLNVVFAERVFPKEITEYETIEHVFNKMLPEAEKNLESMDYRAKSVEELAYSLIINELCQNEIKLERDEVIDRIFQSIGIKYKTVMNYIG